MDIPHYVILKKLTGPVFPVGETNTDNERYENLQHLTDVALELVVELRDIAKFADRTEFSLSKAGNLALQTLTQIAEIIEEPINKK